MAENSAIEWTHNTFNPWIGCAKVSPGCDHCYAESWANRYRKGNLWRGQRQRTSVANWRKPLAWNREAEAKGIRYRVFCSSLADVFDNQVPTEWRDDLWRLIAATPYLDWLLLTKRPQNMANMLPVPFDFERLYPNVWLGTTVENRDEMQRRGPILKAVPARVHFWSCEPMLGDLGSISCEIMPSWIICGGESGSGARPMHPDWARSLRDQCKTAGVPFFFKQWGEFREFDTGSPDIEEVMDGSLHADCALAAAINPSWLTRDGHHITRREDLPAEGEPGARLIERVGKKRAGRLLDGVTHDEFPQTKEPAL